MNRCMHCLERGEWEDRDVCPECEEVGHTKVDADRGCPLCWFGCHTIFRQIRERQKKRYEVYGQLMSALPERRRLAG